MGKIFVTSDIWLNRPMGKYMELDSNEYNDIIIKNWNSTVGNKDDVYILGGIGISDMYQIFIKLNGKIHILDNYVTEDERYFVDVLKKSIQLSVDKKLKKRITFEPSQIIAIPEEDVILSYLPLLDWYGKETGTFCFHGHWSFSDLSEHRISCKSEEWDYKPISIKEIKKNMDIFQEKIL